MIKFIKTAALLAGMVLIVFTSQAAVAQVIFKTDVRVILAATAGNAHVDPGIRDLTRQLQSVFKYTSYRLIQTKKMNLKKNQKGTVRLPGNRTLVVVPTGMDGNRIIYQIRIEKKHLIFQTRVLLQNHNSITIGGPRFKQGVLLLNISGSAR